MTMKKQYERRESGEPRKKDARREVKSRNEARVMHALRHGDLSSLYDDDLGDLGYDEFDEVV